MATKGKIVFPPGPLMLKHVARDKYVYRNTYRVEIPGLPMPMGALPPTVKTLEAVEPDNELKIDGRNLVDIVFSGNSGKVTIRNVWSHTYWGLHKDNFKPFADVISSKATGVIPECLFTPVQDRTTGDIFFKASNDKFIAPDSGSGGRLKAVYTYMDHNAAFKVEVGVLKRVLTNVEYHIDKASSIQSPEPKASGRVSLSNPSNGGSNQTVTRKHTLTVTETKNWATSATVASEVTVNASAPIYSGSGKVSVEGSRQEMSTQGEASAVVTSVEVVDEISASVPPGYKVDVDLLVITGKVKVPFSYTMVDYLIAGHVSDNGGKRFDDGVYTGVNLYETQWEVNESTLAVAS